MLIECYERMGQPARAEPLWRESAALRKPQAGAEAPAYATELAGLGRNLVQQQKYL